MTGFPPFYIRLLLKQLFFILISVLIKRIIWEVVNECGLVRSVVWDLEGGGGGVGGGGGT